MFTLQAGKQHGVAAFKAGQGAKAGSIAYQAEISPTLGAAESGTNRTPSIHSGSMARRLTAEECELLQGAPKGFTRIPWRGKPAQQCPDGPRYKAIGNSMAIPCMNWILTRLDTVNAILFQARRR